MVYKKIVMEPNKKIALVAHDNKKPDLLDWVEYNRGTLEAQDLIATGTTGKLIEERTGLKSTLLLSGPLGGDQQLGDCTVQSSGLQLSGDTPTAAARRDLAAFPNSGERFQFDGIVSAFGSELIGD